MALVYHLTGKKINKVEPFDTWEDAYLFVIEFAEQHDYDMCVDGAEKKETNQFIKILK